MYNLGRRALFVLLLLPLLLVGRGPASALFACAVMNDVQAECCCPDLARGSEQPSLSRACCCERVAPGSTLPSASLRAEWQAPALSAVARSIEPCHAQRPQARAQRQVGKSPARARSFAARAGPSVIILHRRFLI